MLFQCKLTIKILKKGIGLYKYVAIYIYYVAYVLLNPIANLCNSNPYLGLKLAHIESCKCKSIVFKPIKCIYLLSIVSFELFSNVAFLVVADEAYGRTIPNGFLDKIKDEFC